ncbi:hypothetical protein HHK36_005183 [Tetracentron sinense]|uniref:Transcription repressor n=1 Tax=Tetracentron sinense TaxID=13715 RepID=A0A834ZNX2_TETSI|nr:hypothetical protein HHK36_005183 [Tetracentron sinense]
MKWGRKQSSSSRLPLLSHVFPIYWLTKFKQMSNKAEPQRAKSNRKNKHKSSSVGSSLPVSFGDGLLYDGDSPFSPEVLDGRMGRCNSRLSDIDGFWRLSFGDGNFEGETSRNVLRSVWNDSEDELDLQLASYRICRSTEVVEKEETRKFSDMISDIRKMRELPPNVEDLPEIVKCKGMEDRDESGSKTPRRIIVKDGRVVDRKWRKGDQRILKEEQSELHGESIKAKQKSIHPVHEFESELEPVTTIQTTKDDYHSSIGSYMRKSSCLSSSKSRTTNAALEEIDTVFGEESKLEKETEKDLKIKDLLLEGEKQRESLNVSKESQRRRKKKSSKVRGYSPRTALKTNICKIRALEDMKATKMKMKKTSERTVEEGLLALEKFAVVKCSFDPRKDFRDSMVEMITERGIRQPEELEDLLTCYLSLNSDEYHDLIIKVFRQVWFNLNQACTSPEFLEKVHCCYD